MVDTAFNGYTIYVLAGAFYSILILADQPEKI
jgi:hypothetical protein